MSVKDSISLYFKQGNSDKVYQAQIKETDGGYSVDFQYGRRGSSLRAGSKTNSPVDYEKAKGIYAKLVESKVAKGYNPDQSGSTCQDTDLADRKTGILPQLLNPIDAELLEKYLHNDQFIMQEKHDGERRLIKVTQDEVIGINRKGLKIALPEVLANAFADMQDPQCILDGEAIGDYFHVFDLLAFAGEDLKQQPYHERLEHLTDLLTRINNEYLLLVETAHNLPGKTALFERIQQQGGEGVVLKDRNATYAAGRPNSLGNHLKYKFIESASVIVSAITENKRSVAMAVLDNGNQVDVGKVTIKPNQDMPNIGDILEVQYLYAYQGGSLFQPVCLGVRSDLEAADCTIEQLKYKQTPE